MARNVRIEYPDTIYHVTCRMLGDARSRLFVDDVNYERYTLRLSERGGQRQLAAILKVRSVSTISKQLARSRKLLAEEEEWSCRFHKCEQVLNELRNIEQLLND